MAKSLSKLFYFLNSIAPPYPTLIWLFITGVLFFLPSGKTPDPDVPTGQIDKVVHALFFGGILCLAGRDLIRQGKSMVYVKRFLAVLLIVLFFYGVLIEYTQEHYLNRDGNIPDIVANMVGAVIGYFVLPLLQQKFPFLFR